MTKNVSAHTKKKQVRIFLSSEWGNSPESPYFWDIPRLKKQEEKKTASPLYPMPSTLTYWPQLFWTANETRSAECALNIRKYYLDWRCSQSWEYYTERERMRQCCVVCLRLLVPPPWSSVKWKTNQMGEARSSPRTKAGSTSWLVWGRNTGSKSNCCFLPHPSYSRLSDYPQKNRESRILIASPWWPFRKQHYCSSHYQSLW